MRFRVPAAERLVRTRPRGGVAAGLGRVEQDALGKVLAHASGDRRVARAARCTRAGCRRVRADDFVRSDLLEDPLGVVEQGELHARRRDVFVVNRLATSGDVEQREGIEAALGAVAREVLLQHDVRAAQLRQTLEERRRRLRRKVAHRWIGRECHSRVGRPEAGVGVAEQPVARAFAQEGALRHVDTERVAVADVPAVHAHLRERVAVMALELHRVDVVVRRVAVVVLHVAAGALQIEARPRT
eukprot:653959-Prymnesium_polylepis.2